MLRYRCLPLTRSVCSGRTRAASRRMRAHTTQCANRTLRNRERGDDPDAPLASGHGMFALDSIGVSRTSCRADFLERLLVAVDHLLLGEQRLHGGARFM